MRANGKQNPKATKKDFFHFVNITCARLFLPRVILIKVMFANMPKKTKKNNASKPSVYCTYLAIG